MALLISSVLPFQNSPSSGAQQEFVPSLTSNRAVCIFGDAIFLADSWPSAPSISLRGHVESAPLSRSLTAPNFLFPSSQYYSAGSSAGVG